MLAKTNDIPVAPTVPKSVISTYNIKAAIKPITTEVTCCNVCK